MQYYCFRREFLSDADETEAKSAWGSVPAARPSHVHRFHSDNEVTLGRMDGSGYSESAGGCDQPEIFSAREEGHFDFYLAVAEADLEAFGIPFAKMVEERMGMKPCLTLRDIVPGNALYETMAETLEKKCNGKVVFVLSKDFHKSDECQFLLHFAKTLDPYAKQQKLIPLVIDKNVHVPKVLEGLVCINYNAAIREKWLGKRLWEAVRGGTDDRDRHRRRTLSDPFPF